jgi:hypothetical protein
MAMHPDECHFTFSLTPDDFTRQVECAAATQWVKIKNKK